MADGERSGEPDGADAAATAKAPGEQEERSVGSTLSYGPLIDEPRPDPNAFPVPGWDRYTSVRFLGKGGMGKVFLVHDPRLRRDVAIKFVRGDNPEHVRRLIGEARNQARVSHGRVCKVHEVGEVEGKVYIAMQYIDGQSLGALAGELTLEQKVLVVRGAAEGIHEAHRVGIVHRDLKPSNIMVERGEDGELRPYVMDFGLARATQDDGTTQSGALLGTPRYMAPEQARGGSSVDRRADLYSLGATLYHLVTGQPPIDGATVMEVLRNLEIVEPRRPRALKPELPVDLEAIILKCLEHDPSARYDSARALAEDLVRFLNGEPVLARSAGTWYRLRKQLAKHRRLVAVASAALVVALGAIGWGLHRDREAAERARLASRFTELVDKIDNAAHIAALSPRHDLRLDRAAMQLRMVALEIEIASAGASSQAHGHAALGRGYVALGDDVMARAELERAWHGGDHAPRVASQLALTMGRLYHANVLEAARLERAQREPRLRAIEREFRDPAVEYLRSSAGDESASIEYAAALLAFYDGRSEDALQRLDRSIAAAISEHEPSELRGDILLARGFERRKRGEYDGAVAAFNESRHAYRAAAMIGESVPTIQRSLAALEYSVLEIEIYTGGDVEAAFVRGKAAIWAVRELLVDDEPSVRLEASFYRSMAEHTSSRGNDAEDLLQHAVSAAERAVQLAPDHTLARVELAEVYRQWGEIRQGHNQDPAMQLRKAIEAGDAVAVADRPARYYANTGLIFKIWADYDDQVGADSQSHRGQACDAYRRALDLDPQLGDAWGNLGINRYARATAPGARDPDGDLDAAEQALGRASLLDPKSSILAFYLGESHLAIAQRQIARGADARAALAQASAAYQTGIAIDPTLPHLRNAVGLHALIRAKIDWESGRDPAAAISDATAAFAKAIELAPKQGFAYDNMGVAATLRGWLANARGADPSAEIRIAVDWLQQAIQRIPEQAGFWADLAAAHAVLASFDVARGRDPRSSLDQALVALQTARAKNPRDPLAQAVLAQTLAIRARFAAKRGAPGDFESAVAAYEQAISLAPRNQDYRLRLAELYTHWATGLRDRGADPQPIVDRGLAVAKTLLDLRPRWPDALVLHGSLQLVAAQRPVRDPRRHELAEQATDDFEKAFAQNGALKHVWGARAVAARQLLAQR